MTERELTKGEHAVRMSFNPSGDGDVHNAKVLAAKLIDMAERFKDRDARCAALAATAFEEGAMWLVKCITTGKP